MSSFTAILIFAILVLLIGAVAGLLFFVRQQARQIASLVEKSQPSTAITEQPVQVPAQPPLVTAIDSSSQAVKRLAITSHAGGAAKSTSAVELSRQLVQQGHHVLLVDLSPFHSAATLLELGSVPKAQVIGKAGEPSYVWFAPEDRTALESFLKGINRPWVILNLPSLQHPATGSLLSLASHLLVTLRLDPASLSGLEHSVQALSQELDLTRQQLLGALIVRYQEQDALQQSLLKTLQREHANLLFPMPIAENPAVHQAILKAQPCTDPTYLSAYAQALSTLQSRLKIEVQV